MLGGQARSVEFVNYRAGKMARSAQQVPTHEKKAKAKLAGYDERVLEGLVDRHDEATYRVATEVYTKNIDRFALCPT